MATESEPTRAAGPLRRYLPKRLFTRTLLILAAPVILLQALAAALLVERHWAGATRQLAAGVAQEMKLLAAVADSIGPTPELDAALERASRLIGYEISYEEGARVNPPSTPFYDVSRRAVLQAFSQTLGPRAAELTIDGRLRVATRGGALTAWPPPERLYANRPWQLAVWTTGAGFVLLGVAALFLRNQIRPIRDLARAAEAFGKGSPADLRPSGASEVRQAGAAFLRMRARIERQIAQRTMMLTAVSHDLRTPLTRMKLALAMMEDGEETRALKADVDAMARMIESYLDFARGEGAEAAEAVDLAALASAMAGNLRRAGARASYRGPESGLLVMGRRGLLERALQNLGDNAAAYGDRVEISAGLWRGMVEIHVDDDGPGIPAERREEAFQPFSRLEASRGGRVSGVGLGLSITRAAARSHGGDVVLGRGPLGGLRSTLRIPGVSAFG